MTDPSYRSWPHPDSKEYQGIRECLAATRKKLGIDDVVILVPEVEGELMIDGAPVYAPGFVPENKVFIVARDEWERNLERLTKRAVQKIEESLE